MEYIGKFFEYALKTNNIILLFLILACGGLVYLARWVLVTSKDREERYINLVAQKEEEAKEREKAAIERENRYIATIEKLTEKLGKLDIVWEAVKDIKQTLFHHGGE